MIERTSYATSEVFKAAVAVIATKVAQDILTAPNESTAMLRKATEVLNNPKAAAENLVYIVAGSLNLHSPCDEFELYEAIHQAIRVSSGVALEVAYTKQREEAELATRDPEAAE